ncbi:glycosyltransferase family 4 protein [Actinoplanes sp. RD1]|uniref:glycosyltransferase family 4 protein n=1 Tax=Actinoplanes sp. RD1 TaxID=3064538 RepID=UPI002741E2D0|nr:glycosyltransferase family 1 protein [Actinoplanes sp. RD1]
MTVCIGIDGRVLTDRYHGIGRVAYEWIRELSRMPDVRLVVFTGTGHTRRFDLGALAREPSVSVRPVPAGPVDVRQWWRWRRLLRSSGVQVMVYPYHLGASPIAGTPSLALVHDCIFEADPRFAPSPRVRLAYRLFTSLIVRTSAVATVSAASGREVERWYGRRVPSGHVIPNGVDLDRRGTPDGRRRLRDEFGLEPGYVLHVGAQRPHKNVPVLVEAIAKVPETRLVLVGSADERFSDEVGAAITRHGVGDRVTRLSFVPEDLLGSLYAAAGMFAYPSLVEGFGLPVLEAMVADTPVLAADVPVLREVGGDAAQYVTPESATAWAAAIAGLHTDAELRSRLVAAGAAHAAQFTWCAAAARLAGACGALAKDYRAAAR